MISCIHNRCIVLLVMCTGGQGNWSTEGCMISGGGPDSTGSVTCSCNHLTNFAVQVVSECIVHVILNL